MDDLHKGSFTGQFGFVYVEGASNLGQYDQELFLSLRDWEPFFTSTMEDDDDDTHNEPVLEKPTNPNTDPNGLEVGSMLRSFSYVAGAHEREQSSAASWIHQWQTSIAEAYLDRYLKERNLAHGPADQTILRAYVLEKALYELQYELNHRPDWTYIPLRGVLEILSL